MPSHIHITVSSRKKKINVEHNGNSLSCETIESKWLQFYLITRFMMSLRPRVFDTSTFSMSKLKFQFRDEMLSCQNWIEVWWTPERVPYQRQFILRTKYVHCCRWKMMNRNLINSLTWKTSSTLLQVYSFGGVRAVIKFLESTFTP